MSDKIIKFNKNEKLKFPKYCNCKEAFVYFEKDCDDCPKPKDSDNEDI